jgi:hypothetical protein
VGLTISHRKTLLLWTLNRGGQGPIWAVAPLDGFMHISGECVYETYICEISFNNLEIVAFNLARLGITFIFL